MRVKINFRKSLKLWEVLVALNERTEAYVGANRKVTDRVSHEVKARSRRLLDIKYYRTETENSLKEIRQDFSQLRE
jgi:hypothetical protein